MEAFVKTVLLFKHSLSLLTQTKMFVYIRQLSSFRAPTLWFINLTVATCHIQYTFLSLCQIRKQARNTEKASLLIIRLIECLAFEVTHLSWPISNHQSVPVLARNTGFARFRVFETNRSVSASFIYPLMLAIVRKEGRKELKTLFNKGVTKQCLALMNL